MSDINPYLPSTGDGSKQRHERRPRSQLKRFIIGALMGGSIPMLLGVHGLSQFWAYAAALPPGIAVCGNGAFGPIFLIVVAAPLLGAIGGAVAVALR